MASENEYKQITSSEKNATFNFNQSKARKENKLVNEGDSLISFSFFDSFADLFEKERMDFSSKWQFWSEFANFKRSHDFFLSATERLESSCWYWKRIFISKIMVIQNRQEWKIWKIYIEKYRIEQQARDPCTSSSKLSAWKILCPKQDWKFSYFDQSSRGEVHWSLLKTKKASKLFEKKI